MRTLVLLGCAVLCLSCAPSTLAPLSVAPTYWVMVDAAEVPAVQPCAAISELTVEDARSSEPAGRRVSEGQPGSSQPVTLRGDMAAWTRRGIEEIFRQAHLGTGASGKPALRVKIEQITTDEIVFRRAEYDGRVTLLAEAVPAGGGAACFSTRVEGFAENYGFAGNTLNYQETLNHALDRAVLNLLASELPSELCGGC